MPSIEIRVLHAVGQVSNLSNSSGQVGNLSHRRRRPMDGIPLLRRRNLPHWDVPGGTYFVTSCLEGSVPATGRLDIARFRAELEAHERPPEFNQEEWDNRLWKLEF